MRKRRGQSGFTLMEVLVTMAVILILISTLIGTAGYLRTRADIDLTRGLLEVLCCGLCQYYDNQSPNAFPFTADLAFDEAALESLFSPAADVFPDGSLKEKDGNGAEISGASSAALFYFLDRDPASRKIASAVSNTLITNKDADGNPIKMTIGGTPYDLPRYIDPWGTSIRYVYLSGTAFPVLTSAGPDKVFDTPDDITSQ